MPGCKGCGGSISTHNKYGYCRRSADCRLAGSRASKKACYRALPKCKGCGREIRSDNTAGYCRSSPMCKSNYYRAKNAARDGAARVAWRDCHMDSLMWTSAKSRAASRGLEFTITRADIRAVWADVCPVFGYPLAPSHSGTRAHDRASYSLDRIEPSKGYVPGNIQILSQRANTMKSDASPEELLQFAAWIQATYGAPEGGD